MSTGKRQFKIEMILFLCFCLLFAGAVTKSDEQEEESLLVVQYSSGSNLAKTKSGGKVIFSPTPSPAGMSLPTQVPRQGEEPEKTIRAAEVIGRKYVISDLLDLNYLKENFYIVNVTTKMTEADFDINYFLSSDLSVEKADEPQILIYHTHGSEGFADSRPGAAEDTIRGVGEVLTEILQEKYGYRVLHDTTVFDRKNGMDNRNYAYNDALGYLEELLKANPSIEVVIDLHRDAGEKRVVNINGKPTAKVMLFNGLCRNAKGELSYLPNNYLKDNLAFSFQMKVVGDELYPGMMTRIFLKDYRYNMHLKERYLLIELGTEKNTVQEAKNAMEPLADVLAQVLGG